ncbi:glycosyl hydrolase family 16 [Gaetbulibacter sp. M240]|uniref:glycosyl hydrolase family 16 n=1 Tax=Gaetbulibacter sp. M240 TaxID=3126511 RepID=UPI00374F44EC
MKNILTVYSKTLFLFALAFGVIVSCEREISDEATFAEYPSTSDVFTDNPIGLGTSFYLPYGGSKATAWSVDNEVSYEGTASMRFDVPNANDPEGNFAGAIFRIDGDGSGRNLTNFDALTFWAKASQAVNISEIGFGEDFIENKFITTRTNVSLTTNWVKYIIPIPDPSKLFQERGMLRYAAAGIGPVGNEVGYSFWIDELKFEKLGTIAQPKPAILGGQDISEQSFIGITNQLADLTQTFNLASGINQTVTASPAYFTFKSSDPEVAIINESGVYTVIGAGTTVLTAQLNGVKAAGSLTLESLGNFVAAPDPTEMANNVISVFSDAYDNIPVDFYNGFFAPFQTTLGGANINVNGNNIIQYTDLNFVATEFKNPTIDVSQYTFFHVDIQVQEPIQSGDFISIELGDFGSDNAFGGNNDSSGRITLNSSELLSNQWISLDIPLSDFNLSSRSNLAQIFFISDATISTILVDNMYFYKQ